MGRIIVGCTVLVLLLGAGVLPVGAEQIFQSLSFGPDTPNYSDTLTFDKFDDQGGTRVLLSVLVGMELDISGGWLGVDNDGQEQAIVDVDLGATGEVTSTDVTVFPAVETGASTQSNFLLDPDDGDGPGNVDLSPLDGATHSGGVAGDSTSKTILSTFYPEYIGTGTFDVLAEIDQILDFGGVGGVEGSFSPVTAGGSVTVTYNWAPVPEPSALALLGMGAFGLLACVWRKRRR